GPPGAEAGQAVRATPLYHRAGLKLSLAAPAAGEAAFEEYISDPAKPVPFRARPIQPLGYGEGNTWSQWLVDDQREASGRPDVVAFLSDTLTAPVRVSGEPVANLVASTSGTDSDWVVKLIDVYPDEVAGDLDGVDVDQLDHPVGVGTARGRDQVGDGLPANPHRRGQCVGEERHDVRPAGGLALVIDEPLRPGIALPVAQGLDGAGAEGNRLGGVGDVLLEGRLPGRRRREAQLQTGAVVERRRPDGLAGLRPGRPGRIPAPGVRPRLERGDR